MAKLSPLMGTEFPDSLDSALAGDMSDSLVVVRAGAGGDEISLRDGAWAVGSSGDDTITGVGFGIFGVRFDDSPGPVLVRADRGRVENDGFGNRDVLRGINAFMGGAFDDTIVGSRANDHFGSLDTLPQGADSYVGGGGFDTVYYGASFSEFKLDYLNGSSKVLVTYTARGTTDTLEGIGSIQFLDKSLELMPKGNSNYNIRFSNDSEVLAVESLLPPSLITRWGDIRAGAGDDKIIWRSGQIYPQQGDDTITFLAGAMDARVNYGEDPGPVFIDLAKKYAMDGWGGRDQFVNVAAVSGTRFADTILGSADNDRFDFSSGGDTIDGAGGTDRLWMWVGDSSRKYSLSYLEDQGLYALRNDPYAASVVYFKNIEEIELGRSGQPNLVLYLKDLTVARELSLDFIKSPTAAASFSGTHQNENVLIPSGKWVDPGGGFDTIQGYGAGEFGIRFDSSPKAVNIRADWDRVVDDGFGYSDMLRGINAFVGSRFSDFIQGSWRDESFGDRLNAPQGADTYIGGGGYDTVYYGANYAEFKLDIDRNADKAQITFLKSGTTDVLTGIANLVFKDRSVGLKDAGNSTPELYYGDSSERIVEKSIINDNSVGRWRHIYAGGGDDYVAWSSGQLHGEEGNDTIEFTSGDRSARANYGRDPSAVFVDLQNGYARDGWGDKDTLVNVRAVRGSNYADTLWGSAGDDWFDDPYGGDTIDGAAGNDTIWFWADRKNYLTSFDPGTSLYTIRWDEDKGYFSFKNIEQLRIAMPGQSDRNLAPSELTTVKDQIINTAKLPASQLQVFGGTGSDQITLSPGKWAIGGAGYDQIEGIGLGSFGIRFDNSPKGINLRADWGRVEDDGFGFRDLIRGVNAFFGSPFDDYIRGSGSDEIFGSSVDVSKGNDTYSGGGGFDVLVYPSNRSDYELTYDAIARKGQVKNTKTGFVDSIEEISEVKFKDLSIPLQSFGNLVNTLWGSDGDDIVNKRSMLPEDRWTWWVDYNGGDGADRIVWQSGSVIGGRGNDSIEALGDGRSVWLNFDNAPNGVYVNLKEGYALDGWGFRDSLTNIHLVNGTWNRADTIIGSDGDDEVGATQGGDFIDLGAGNDVLRWGANVYSTSISPEGYLILRDYPGPHGATTIRNVETIRFTFNGDRDVPVSDLLATAIPENTIDLSSKGLKEGERYVVGTSGADTIILTPGSWAMAGSGFDVIKAQGQGLFGVRFDTSPAPVEVRVGWGLWAEVQNDGFGFRDSLIGVNAFFGSPYNDIFYGDWRDQTFGSADTEPMGNDSYIGNGGFDVVQYFGDESQFRVTKTGGGSGSDQKFTVEYLKTGTVDSLDGIASIKFKDKTLELFSWGQGRKTVWGSNQADVIVKKDYFSGDEYNRWQDVRGGPGNDSITWTAGDVWGGEGQDTIEAEGDGTRITLQYGDRGWGQYGVYVNLLEGYAIDDWGDRDKLINVKRVGLTGGNDTVIGTSGDDYFWDSGGNDTIDGGQGEDTYSFWMQNKGNYQIKASEDLTQIILSWDGQHNGNSSGSVLLKNFELIRIDRDGNNDDFIKISDLVNWKVQAPKALIAADTIRWGSSADLGTPVEITYSFMESMPAYGSGSGGVGFSALTAGQREAVKLALGAATQSAGIVFKQLADSDSVDIRFGANQQQNTKAYSFLPDKSIGPIAGDVWLDLETLQVMTPGKEGYWVLLHELGHALGLTHPNIFGEVTGDAVIDQAFNDTRYTVMSEKFFTPGQFPVNFSMFDVLALRYLYGDSKVGVGNSQYMIGNVRSKAITTINDADGWDVIDASSSTTGVYVDLHEGSLLSAGRDQQDFYTLFNWAIGYDTEIERVIGSAFDDILIGTERSESFFGGDGNDQIDGGGGLDRVEFSGKRSEYEVYVSKFSGRLIVSSIDGESGSDSLNEIERLIFSDGGLAFDSHGAAGDSARMVFTMFGEKGVSDPNLFGFTLSSFDSGLSDEQIANKLLESAWFQNSWGERTDRNVLKMMFQSLFERDPAQEEYLHLLPLFQVATQAKLVSLVANFPMIDDLIGGDSYYANGIPFGP